MNYNTAETIEAIAAERDELRAEVEGLRSSIRQLRTEIAYLLYGDEGEEDNGE